MTFGVAIGDSVSSKRRKAPFYGAFEEADEGLEPSTFCMANARERSRLFAQVRWNRLFAEHFERPANASEPERTMSDHCDHGPALLCGLRDCLSRGRSCRGRIISPLGGGLTAIDGVLSERTSRAA